MNFRVQPLALGNILDETDDVFDLARFIAHQRSGQVDPERRAILALHAAFYRHDRRFTAQDGSECLSPAASSSGCGNKEIFCPSNRLRHNRSSTYCGLTRRKRPSGLMCDTQTSALEGRTKFCRCAAAIRSVPKLALRGSGSA
jgi:hypothetical protein